MASVALLAAVLTLLAVVFFPPRWLCPLRSSIAVGQAGRESAGLKPLLDSFRTRKRRILERWGLRPGAPVSDDGYTRWTAARLRKVMQEELGDAEIIVVSNREPYIHNHGEGEIKVQRPAGGLVSALEPVMRTCGGTWIAQGSGSADRKAVDAKDRIAVPPDTPAYTLRRIWFSDEEQGDHYCGLANEGLWPLCHAAFVQPVFRETDWQAYRAVNERFANAVAEEAATEAPIVLVQDYHLALLPRLVRKRLPKATIITFWHIPWPNSEIFGICPWKEEILQGLLGSSILGFHTQRYCNNFIETVEQFMESRSDREQSSILLEGRETLVRPYPISIEWPPAALAVQAPVPECRATVRTRLGLPPDICLAVSVERLDYIKGILERMRAVDTFLTAYPQWKERLVFLQAAAPTRTKLPAYAHLKTEAQRLADEINARHGSPGFQPVRLAIRHHDAPEVFAMLRAADVCIVSSLHDGMNLTAKEFVASRDDEQGVLLLSTFAGASRELPEALMVNPYDVHSMAAALDRGLTMPPAEQRERMHRMREQVRTRNVYRWAGLMLLDASVLRRRM